MDKFDFNGKKVLVTGASSGVGREVAILLSKMGAKIVIISRRKIELKKTISLMTGDDHQYRVLDLADFNALVSTIKDIVAKDREKFDYIAHCAGVAVPVPLRSMSLDNIVQTFSINTFSFMALLKCVAQKRLFNDCGAVVGISSCVGVYGQAANAVYGASKGAMDAFMKSAAKELRPRKIRVNTICPCGIKTEMLANQAVKDIDGDCVDTLPNYLMLPDKVASIVVTLLSDSMKYISGVAIDVDEAKTWEV
ncbi:MAG: SDR family oxidoreductase [Phascolarctobacterium sp.]|uniref:SDR family oxidoreductase n=1 Tax=Phascolarctobacterium sp. TaxID=2049039 RepID=UPI0026DD466C|nr:SDR family oxidoreductase [Phascolarctobacterium sp.]MDO4922255.1 SDR family oxidoreductase [Phascolarctobacterium sp.]